MVMPVLHNRSSGLHKHIWHYFTWEKKINPPFYPSSFSQTSPCPTPIPPTYTIKQGIPIPRLRRRILRFFSQTPTLSLVRPCTSLHHIPFLSSHHQCTNPPQTPHCGCIIVHRARFYSSVFSETGEREGIAICEGMKGFGWVF